MRTKEKLIKSSGIVKILLFGSSLVTLAFWTKFADPFNPLKLTLILTIAFWSLGHIIVEREQILRKSELKITLILVSIFLISLLFATLNSNVRQVAWLGDYQRNNGFLFYFGLSIILVASASYFKVGDFRILSNLTLMLGFLISIYGLFQINGKDFVKWSNPYNEIISTVGNPNFAGAILAAMGVLSFGFALSVNHNWFRLVLNVIVTILILIIIILSEARQGLIGLAVGCIFVMGVWLYYKSKIIGKVFFIFSICVGILAVLGMLQTGPLAQFLYKDSVTIRGYYWRAGVKMFLDHPWFGVGSDYYGGYFKQYREVGYPINYGYEITSTNAHNVFIQLFSTAGIFTGIAYLLIVLHIFRRGIIGIRNVHKDYRIHLTTILGAWLTLQSISVISIDSPGVSIWSWVLGGIVIAVSHKANDLNDTNDITHTKYSINSKLNKSPKQVLLSSLLITPVFLLSMNIFKVENSVQFARLIYNPKEAENTKYLLTLTKDLVNEPTINTTSMTELASYVATSGKAAEGIEVLEYAIAKDPRNQDAISLLASYYFELKQPEKALKLRLRIIELDPYNAKNYYQLGIIYKTLGDFASMEKMQKMILSFARDTPEGAVALKDLVP